MQPKHCRICFKPDNDDLISVRLKQEGVSIEQMIFSISGICVTSDRRLPQNICLECLDRLKVAYEIRQQCIRMNDWLCEKLLVLKEDIKVEHREEDAPESNEASDGGEKMVQNSIAFEATRLYEEEMEPESNNEQEPPEHSDDECNVMQVNTDSQSEDEIEECLEGLVEERSSLQKLEIEIDTGEHGSDTKEQYLLSEFSGEEDELTIEVNASERSTVDIEGDLDGPYHECPYEEDWEQQATEKMAQQSQTNKIQRAICRISENNLLIRSAEQGYNIVELRPHRCCCCEELFTTEEELNEHLKGRENKEDVNGQPDPSVRYVCEYCGKHFKLWLVYICHKRMREQRQFYQCRLCNVLLDSATRMISHMLLSEQHANYFNLSRESIADRYTSIALPGERCCCCKKYFDQNEKRLEHVQHVHRSSTVDKTANPSHACDVCGRRFMSKDRLNAHLQYTVNVMQHYCKQCEFQTYNPRRMELHLYSGIHRDADLPAAIELKPLENNLLTGNRLQYCCFEGCNKPFPNQSALRQHIQEAHQDTLEMHKVQAERISNAENLEKFHECNNCYAIFKSLTGLYAHQGVPKRTRQEFVCSVCGVSKRSQSDLVVHERAHTGERPFPCDHCDKTFASKKTLASHCISHLPRQNACELCGGRFNRKEHLTRHITLKHGTATIPCDVCGKKFKTIGTLNIHKVSHT
uniref:Uncharacterized protein n=1 Tax=Anopheles christyi TaxID=43041 RepID=A0A182JU90_9DIPT